MSVDLGIRVRVRVRVVMPKARSIRGSYPEWGLGAGGHEYGYGYGLVQHWYTWVHVGTCGYMWVRIRVGSALVHTIVWDNGRGVGSG